MRKVLVLALLSSTLVLNAGCNRPAAAGGSPAGSAPKILVLKPEQRAIQRTVEQPGTVQAFEETALYAKVPGYVGSITEDPNKKGHVSHDRQIDIGSRVVKGQILAELHVPELDKEWKQKMALVKQAEAEVIQSERAFDAMTEGVSAARAAVAEAQAGIARSQAMYDRWQAEVTRLTSLVKKGVFEQGPLDETRNQFKAAEAARAEANARVASAQAAVKKAEADRGKAAADVDAIRAKLEVTRADVERIEALRDYTKIRAPFAGVVTHRKANTGDFVTGNEKGGLFSVARVDPVRVVISVPEADAGLINSGQDVSLIFQSGAMRSKAGKVTRTSWSLEPGSRTLRVEVDLPNSDGAIRPGMYVNARLTATLSPAWGVPAAAVGKAGDEPVVFLVEGGKAVRVPVRLGRGDGQFTQLRQYRRVGSNEWTDFKGDEQLASPAVALSDGLRLPG
jgi:HlyD family secretion protein